MERHRDECYMCPALLIVVVILGLHVVMMGGLQW